MVTTKKCYECDGKIVRLTAEGRYMEYYGISLPIPADIPIPTCKKCGSEWIDEETAWLLDEALEVAFIEEIIRRGGIILKKDGTVYENKT